MFLTKNEITQLSGYKQSAAQIRWLKHMGIAHLVDRWGNPLTSQEHINSVLSGGKQKLPSTDGFRLPSEKTRENATS